MKATFIQLDLFAIRWSRLGLNDEAARQLENQIMQNPSAAPIVRGTGGARTGSQTASRRAMRKKRSTTTKKTFGREIIDALEDFNRSLKRGEPIESKYTVHTVEIPEPTPFKPSDIKALRNRLSASQAIFARLVGVSPVLVEHWERGERTPHPVACRLLELIAKDPAGYMKQYLHRKAG